MVLLKHICDSLIYLFYKVTLENNPRGTNFFFNVILIINFEENDLKLVV